MKDKQKKKTKPGVIIITFLVIGYIGLVLIRYMSYKSLNPFIDVLRGTITNHGNTGDDNIEVERYNGVPTISYQTEEGVIVYASAKDYKYVKFFISIATEEHVIFKNIVLKEEDILSGQTYTLNLYSSLTSSELLMARQYKVTKLEIGLKYYFF